MNILKFLRYKWIFGFRSRLFVNDYGKLIKVNLAKNISLPIKRNLESDERALCTYNLISRDAKSPSDGLFNTNWYLDGTELHVHHYRDGDIGIKSVKLRKKMHIQNYYFKTGTEIEYIVLAKKRWLKKPKLDLVITKAIEYKNHGFGNTISQAGTVLSFKKSGIFPKREFIKI